MSEDAKNSQKCFCQTTKIIKLLKKNKEQIIQPYQVKIRVMKQVSSPFFDPKSIR